MLLFANDTSILEVLIDPILSFKKINRDLTKLHPWLKQWLVNFIPDKTKKYIFIKIPKALIIQIFTLIKKS
jgi:hypothetical protein